jgi:hypothetical protein
MKKPKVTVKTLKAELALALANYESFRVITDERFSSGGCESCDYGSCYGFTLEVRP